MRQSGLAVTRAERGEDAISYTAKAVLSHPALLLASGFGSGFLPYAPGTWGTLLAAVLFLPMTMLEIELQWLVVIVTIIGGVPICEIAERESNDHDPGWVVWDEMAATWLLMLMIGGSWPWLLTGLVGFRLFDILKPWPINWVDRRVSGGVGIMLDDLVAICPVWLLVMVAQWLLSSWS